MPGVARRIGRLHLAVTREEDVFPGRTLVQDAFRMASFPPTGGRVLVIRRLDLGAVDLRRSPAALATAIEAATRDAAAHAVAYDAPGAAAAPAVRFPDATAAAVALINRLAAGPRPTEWFWRRAVPGWQPNQPAPEAIRAALRSLLEDRAGRVQPPGAATLAVALDAVRRAGVLDAVLATLTPADGAGLLASVGIRPLTAAASAPHALPGLASESRELGEWRLPVAVWCRHWGAADPRSRWLAAMAVLSAMPQWGTGAGLEARSARFLADALRRDQRPLRRAPPRFSSDPRPGGAGSGRGRPAAATVSLAGEVGPSPEPAQSTGSTVGRAGEAREERPERSPVTPAGSRRAHDARSGPPRGTPLVPAAGPARRPTTVSAVDESWEAAPEEGRPGEHPDPSWELAPTGAAGLFFVVPLLTRLGIEDALAADPTLVETDFASRLLRHVADRVRVPPDDGIRLALRPPPDPDEIPAQLTASLSHWFTRLRRSCHWVARMGLCALVRRPGLVAATRTHVDIVLSLAGADIRIRRAGLDCDPGWAPWLGQVVAFHYRSEP